jgi:quinoprotein glucose dehydrogenase
LKSRRLKLLLIAAASTLCLSCANEGASGNGSNWLLNGGPGGDHFSPLTQIDASNVAQLQEAWRFDLAEGGLQAQPLVIDGVLYGPTPDGNLVALDAATGEMKWKFETGLPEGQPIRGLVAHGSGAAMRLMFASRNFIYAINPRTGSAIRAFGVEGRVDVRANLRGDADDNGMFLTSPGSIYKDLYIFSGRVSESTPSSPGDVRAIDVKTGQFRWTFHTIPHPGEPGAETWPEGAHLTQGGANAWAGSVVDVARGIVFLTTGSPADDFYGAARLGNNRFANSVIALDAKSGRLLWDFQAVRHDLWDMDFNSAPVLMTVERDGKSVDAVAATNKLGYIYIFDRVTGEPLFEIDEKPVPASTVPGEIAAPTQPVPRLPAPLSRTSVSEADLTDRTPAAAAWAQRVWAQMNGGGRQFTPMTVGKDTLVLSGFTGGVGWGGMAADRNGIIYANASDTPGISQIVESASLIAAGVGERAYQQQCSSCHGADRAGVAPDFPPLIGIGDRLSEAEIRQVITNGRGRMPGFSSMPADQVGNLVSYLTTGRDLPGTARTTTSLQGRFAPSETLYTSNGNRNFVDEDGYPGVKPPWGTLSAINMNTGQYLWRIPFGVTKDMGPEFGGSNTGGAVVTGSGLLFIGASTDRKFRAFDTRTGRVLWEATLTANGTATPATYMANGRQFVVIAASARRPGGGAAAAAAPARAAGGLAAEGAGHSAQGPAAQGPASAGGPTRNAYIAFALPR